MDKTRRTPFKKRGLYYCCLLSAVLLLVLRCTPSLHDSWCAALSNHHWPELCATPDDDAIRPPTTPFRPCRLPNNILYVAEMVRLPIRIPYSAVHTSCLRVGTPCELHLKLEEVNIYSTFTIWIRRENDGEHAHNKQKNISSPEHAGAHHHNEGALTLAYSDSEKLHQQTFTARKFKGKKGSYFVRTQLPHKDTFNTCSWRQLQHLHKKRSSSSSFELLKTQISWRSRTSKVDE